VGGRTLACSYEPSTFVSGRPDDLEPQGANGVDQECRIEACKIVEGTVDDGGGVVLALRLLDGHWRACPLGERRSMPQKAFRHHVSVATSDCQVCQHATLPWLEFSCGEVCIATRKCRMQRSATVGET
jgi:hypothetical protein